MIRKTLTAGLCLAALGLAACADDGGRRVNAKLCADFKPATAPAASATADAAAPVDDCVKRWAYSLAPSTDDADTVAAAAVAACAAALARWNQASLTQTDGSTGPVEAISITTGQPTNPLAEHNGFANSRALLYVVQARAGRCKAPPIANGAPEGLTL